MKQCLRGIAAICALTVAPALPAQTDEVEEAEDQKYGSVRINIYTKRFRELPDHSFGLKLNLAVSTAIYRYETLDEFFDPDIEHINAIGVRPKLEFEFPTGLTGVTFLPGFQLSFNRTFDTDSRLIAGAARAALRYQSNREDTGLKIETGIKYGTEFEYDGLNFDDYVEIDLDLHLRPWRAMNLGERHLTIRPFGKIANFIDDLEFETESGAEFEVDRQYEIGFEFGTEPRKKIWRLSLPSVKLSFAFGDDFQGVKLRL